MQSRQPTRRVFRSSIGKAGSRNGCGPTNFELGESPMLPANAVAFESKVD
jgi:hypothetical protein